jgi:hypothetical protein
MEGGEEEKERSRIQKRKNIRKRKRNIFKD